MTSDNKKPSKRGRPPAPKKLSDLKEGKQSKQTKLGPKKQAEEFYKSLSKEFDTVGLYGLDDYVVELLELLWQDPSKVIFATDDNKSRLDNINRKIANRRFSSQRWEAVATQGFIEEPMYDIVIVSKDCADSLKKRPNPYDTMVIVLEDVKYD
jgi:hypothetical protein